MILKNGFVVCDDFALRKTDIKIEGEKIVDIGKNLQGEDIRDFTGKFILPGFIDTHIHGACGARISDPECELEKITNFEATQGVTSLAVTTTAAPKDKLLEQITFLKNNKDKVNGSKIAGIIGAASIVM